MAKYIVVTEIEIEECGLLDDEIIAAINRTISDEFPSVFQISDESNEAIYAEEFEVKSVKKLEGK